MLARLPPGQDRPSRCGLDLFVQLDARADPDLPELIKDNEVEAQQAFGQLAGVEQ
jgi:hypothetical protein